MFLETIEISMFGADKKIILDILEEARVLMYPPGNRQIDIHMVRYGEWRRINRFAPRLPESIILAEGMYNDILSDMKTFLADQKWYASTGIPWRRGYLLYGPPGNGKSSLVSTVAGDLGIDLYVVHLSSVANDQALVSLLSDVPMNSIVLMEDIDAARGRPREDDPDGTGFSYYRISFSKTNVTLCRPGDAGNPD